jgi:hypothetical protein
MNFDKIKESYPKAWERLSDWAHPQGKGFTYYPGIGWRSSMNDRDLYDFFDAHGMEIYPYPFLSDFGPRVCYKAYIDNVEVAKDFRNFPTRAAAESSAFEKAFEILENKLK